MPSPWQLKYIQNCPRISYIIITTCITITIIIITTITITITITFKIIHDNLGAVDADDLGVV